MRIPIARTTTTVLASAALTLGVSGCDGDTVMAAPPAYGAAGYCYYVDSPAEAIALQHAGLCPVTWTPTVMPSPWRARYAWYYDSPRYYDHYVPARARTVYVTHVHVYEKTTRGITTKAPKATTPATSSRASTIRDSTSRQGFSSGTRPSRPSTASGSARPARSSFRSGSRR